jgi:hypothetical protein
MRIWFRLKIPVSFAPEIQRPLIRLHHSWHVVLAACLKQEDVNFGVLREPARHHGTRTAGSANNKVVL